MIFTSAQLRNSIHICMHNNLQFPLPVQDELESYSFKSIYRCDAINTEKHFPSLLLLVCQSADQKKPDIHFFNCETVKVSNNNNQRMSSLSSLTQSVILNCRPVLVQVLRVMPLPDCHSRRQSKSVTTSRARFRVPQGVRRSPRPSGTVNVTVTGQI